MKNQKSKRIFLSVVSVVLAWAMAFTLAACKKNTISQKTPDGEVSVIGEGERSFYFTVIDKDGSESSFLIHTDKDTVGEALTDAGLLEGEEGPYGLYVKKVNKIVADYDIDGTYWAFYIDGEMAMTGVDMTKIEDGHNYTFKVEK